MHRNTRLPSPWLPGILAVCAVLLLGTLAAAKDPPREQVEFFEKKVRPVLAEHCFACHSAAKGKKKGGLLLDSREAILQGGDTGPALVPSEPDKSLLIKAIRHTDPDLKMPPKNPLTAMQVA